MFIKLIRIILLAAIGCAGVWFFFQKKNGQQEQQPIIASSAQNGKGFLEEEVVSYRSMQYLLLKPIDYDSSEKYPLVLFFHGGDMPEKNAKLPVPNRRPMYGLSYDFLKEHPCFVLIPQAPQEWWTYGKSGSLITETKKYIDYHLIEELPIDPARLYTVGYSAGGSAVLHMLFWHPDYFAGAISMAGWVLLQGQPRDDIKKMVESKTAIWMFSAKDDPFAAWWAIDDILAAFKKWRGNLKVTVMEGKHGAPIHVFNSLCHGKKVPGTKTIATSPACDIQTANPMEWLFKQRLD